MYQLDEHHSAHRNRATQPHTGLRVVRLPGGFAYLDEGSITHTSSPRNSRRRRT